MFLIMVLGTVVAPPQTGLLNRSLSSRQQVSQTQTQTQMQRQKQK